jgi:metal-responsive CopG/Arc/MetJ family transcriptional regulator
VEKSIKNVNLSFKCNKELLSRIDTYRERVKSSGINITRSEAIRGMLRRALGVEEKGVISNDER